jgi:hypothetical protein
VELSLGLATGACVVEIARYPPRDVFERSGREITLALAHAAGFRVMRVADVA